MEYQADFDKISMGATKGPCKGEYYGLPWPCWGTPEMKHPGSAVLYDTSKHVMEGGTTFRARFGIERNGVSLLADGSYTVGSEITDGYPEFTMAVLKKLGWDADLTADEMAVINKIGGDNVDQVSWMTDLSIGHHPGRAEARLRPPSATPRRGRWPGTCRTRCRSTASRSIRRGAIWWSSTPRWTTAATSA